MKRQSIISFIYKYKPSMLKVIRILQRSTDPLLSRKVIHSIMQQKSGMRISKKASEALQAAADDHMHVWFESMGTIAIRSGRTTVMKSDADALKAVSTCNNVQRTKTRSIPKAAFTRLVRGIVTERKPWLRITDEAKQMLQFTLERRISTWFKKLGFMTEHRNRKTVNVTDVVKLEKLERYIKP